MSDTALPCTLEQLAELSDDQFQEFLLGKTTQQQNYETEARAILLFVKRVQKEKALQVEPIPAICNSILAALNYTRESLWHGFDNAFDIAADNIHLGIDMMVMSQLVRNIKRGEKDEQQWEIPLLKWMASAAGRDLVNRRWPQERQDLIRDALTALETEIASRRHPEWKTGSRYVAWLYRQDKFKSLHPDNGNSPDRQLTDEAARLIKLTKSTK